MLLDGMAYVAHKAVGLGSLHTYLQTLLGHTHKLLLLGSSLAYDKHTRSVGIIAIENSCEVHIHDVAILKDILLLRNAMTHHLVDACAHTLGETLVVETSRYGTMRCAIVVANLVNLESAHSCMNMLGHLVEHTSIHHTAAANALYLLRSLYEVARRHLFAFVLPIHHFLVKFGWLLSRKTMPNSLSFEYHVVKYFYSFQKSSNLFFLASSSDESFC